jgi:hypothetical protein
MGWKGEFCKALKNKEKRGCVNRIVFLFLQPFFVGERDINFK